MVKNMLKEYRSLFISILIPLGLGLLVGLLTRGGVNNLENLVLPSFMPPGYLFAIIWPILYLLMGISSYLIYNSYSCYTGNCLIIYYVQLIVNLLWPIIFFILDLRLFALIWIILLVLLVLYMIWCFLGVNKKAAYLQIPYLLWLLFATFLNYTIYILNR